MKQKKAARAAAIAEESRADRASASNVVSKSALAPDDIPTSYSALAVCKAVIYFATNLKYHRQYTLGVALVHKFYLQMLCFANNCKVGCTVYSNCSRLRSLLPCRSIEMESLVVCIPSFGSCRVDVLSADELLI